MLINAICSSAVSLEQTLSAKISGYLLFLLEKKKKLLVWSQVSTAADAADVPQSKGIYMSSGFICVYTLCSATKELYWTLANS